MAVINQERWINDSIRGILRIFCGQVSPSGLTINKLSGVAIGTLRRSPTMGFFACFTSCLSVSQSVRSVSRRSGSPYYLVGFFFCGPYVSRANKVAHKRSDSETMMIPDNYSVGFLSLLQLREGRA